jgi:acetoin utilization deacetylase AcuC-like enzyme
MIAPPLITFYSEAHLAHDPGGSHPEVPGRAFALRDAAIEAGSDVLAPTDFGLGPIAAVHTSGLIDFLQTAYDRFAKLPEGPRPALPDTFAVRHLVNGRLPRGIWGQLGHYCNDNLTPILPDTWDAAYWSAQTALSAASAVAGGAPLAYALCRPPGHHAYADLYGGFCYLNNAAIAAQWLAGQGRRMAVLDIDYHHGNGTQGIFYERGDILTCSIHADPDHEYPYYCGFAAETGAGPGDGCNMNLPLPPGADDAAYQTALGAALARVNAFAPDVLLLAAGFDTVTGDVHGGFRLTVGAFHAVGRAVAGLGLPVVVIQEGGYLLPVLGDCLSALLAGLRA